MKKRIISLFLVLTLVISVGTVTVGAGTLEDLQAKITKITDIGDSVLSSLLKEMEKAFKDTNQNSWYAKHVAKILGVKGINGYPDGTFKPNGTITRAEFTKILIAALYGEQSREDCATHWACAYVTKAESVGILTPGEVNKDNIDKPITRQEMAKMISLASQKSLNEAMATNLTDMSKVIKDSNTFNTTYKNHILNAYSKGIITGYPDDTFGPSKTATRAEASTMLVRLLDAKEREKVGAGYNTVERLGLKEEPKSNYGNAFESGLDDSLMPIDNVVFIKISDLPLQIGERYVLHDIKLSDDKKHILVTREILTGSKRFGIGLSVKGENMKSRNSVEYYEKDLGNGKYQTTHYISSIADDAPITLDMVQYISFDDIANGRDIALEKGELFK